MLVDIVPTQKAAVMSLMRDESCRDEVLKHVGEWILGSDGVIGDLPFDQIAAIVSLAAFADSSDERVAVAKSILTLIGRPDVIPMVSEHKGFALASRCLVSLSLFRPAMVRFHGIANVPFYRSVGKTAYGAADLPAVSEHFEMWEGFIGEMLVV